MSTYSEFFLNGSSNSAELECIEISHSSFSKYYRIVRNANDLLIVRHENGLQYTYEYQPLSIKLGDSTTDLDQSIKIVFGDLGELIPYEVGNIIADDSWSELPVLKYRVFDSSNLESPLLGPIVMNIIGVAFTNEGSTLECQPSSTNINKTGERYKLDRFPMLKGFL